MRKMEYRVRQKEEGAGGRMSSFQHSRLRYRSCWAIRKQSLRIEWQRPCNALISCCLRIRGTKQIQDITDAPGSLPKLLQFRDQSASRDQESYTSHSSLWNTFPRCLNLTLFSSGRLNQGGDVGEVVKSNKCHAISDNLTTRKEAEYLTKSWSIIHRLERTFKISRIMHWIILTELFTFPSIWLGSL